ncbi:MULTISPECIES: hypothetical protein [Myxococcus]|uniref:hypothetical protein n=2 Tax=Myxococcaceae TaxID=31 RepID=UPI00114116DF|nr:MULTISPECIES: hypothetical protein [Myxococcus]NOK05972.1 hypothetical protein [Myxococcus xanthus]
MTTQPDYNTLLACLRELTETSGATPSNVRTEAGRRAQNAYAAARDLLATCGPVPPPPDGVFDAARDFAVVRRAVESPGHNLDCPTRRGGKCTCDLAAPLDALTRLHAATRGARP